jgi:hypothetical protein
MNSKETATASARDRGSHSPRHIFVFGSNLAGRHGAGSAKAARRHYGAQYGVGVGPTGDSYAIPTKGYNLEVLPLDLIAQYVLAFLSYAEANPEMEFHICKIGCGLAGYQEHQIAPLFANAPPNCVLPEGW